MTSGRGSREKSEQENRIAAPVLGCFSSFPDGEVERSLVHGGEELILLLELYHSTGSKLCVHSVTVELVFIVV